MQRAIQLPAGGGVRTRATPSRHFSFLNTPEIGPVFSMVFGFLLAGTTVAASNGIGVYWIYLCAMSMAALAGLFPHAVVRGNARNALLWAYPAWIILSIGWSTVPAKTVHASLLVIPTVIVGLGLGGSRKRREINAGAAGAMFVFMLVSLSHGGHTLFSDTASGGEALTGLGSGKNFFGHLAAVSTILAASFFAFRGTPYGRLFALIGVADLLVSGYALKGSHATGSILACIIAYGIIGLVLLFARVGWQLRVLLLATTIGVLVLYVTFGPEIQKIIFEGVLQRFNKDTSLTGRTILWDYADRLMLSHRLLGYGYSTFWTETNPDAWAIWRMMGMQPGSGFNFHNTMRETLIECGLLGFGIYVATFGWAFVRTFFRALTAGDLTSGVRLAFIVYFVVRMPVESTGFGAFTIDTIFLLAFLSVPLRRQAKEAPAAGAPAWTRPRRPLDRLVAALR